MEDHMVSQTPGATMRFGSLGFICTRPAEPVAGGTFIRPPHPNVLTGTAGCATFVRGFSDKTIMAMFGAKPNTGAF
jgi:hypothetical protein